MSRATKQQAGRSGRRETVRRGRRIDALSGRALAHADAMQASGRIARADRITFAWGWAEGFRAALRSVAERSK